LTGFRLVVVLVAALVVSPAPATAQATIDHLRLIAPAAPGGGWDQTARAMQAALQAAGLVGTSSVENIPGAAGTIGLAHLIGAERGDGDVLMLSGLIMLGAVVTHRSPVTLADVTPVARLVGEYEVVVVPAGSPMRTLADLVAAFRAAPESISWGGGSAGGTDQILAGLFADAVGVDPRRVNYIAYSGGGESLSAILGGQVSVGVNGLAELAPHIASGAVRVLAISSAARLPGVDAPTFREQGVDLEIENWRSVVAPPGLTSNQRTRLEQTVGAMVASAAWRATLTQYRWTDRYLSGLPFAQFVAAEEARVQRILAKLGTGRESETTSLAGVGRYPLFVFVGLAATGLVAAAGLWRDLRRASVVPAPLARVGAGPWKAVGLIVAAGLLELWLLERAGFVLASSLLFWLVARAFDPSRPLRDGVVAVTLSLSAYVLFARLLDIALPPGLLAGVL
jgi:putative tricarboxylic transport membrane protein